MPEASIVRILIADDHPIFRSGLRRLLEAQPTLRVVGEAGDGTQTVVLTKQLKPDILLLDVAMPGNGIEVVRQLSRERLDTRIILLTAGIEQAQVLEAFRLGARGMVVKGAEIESLLESIWAVAAGEIWIGRKGVADVFEYVRTAYTSGAERKFGLTAREMEIITEILGGSTNKDIAAKLNISPETVKRHLSNIYDKLGVSTRLELLVFAGSHKLGANY